MAGLYAGLARGGEFAPPSDPPRPRRGRDPVRLIGPAAVWYVADVLADAPLPEGFANLPVEPARAPGRLQDRHVGGLPRCLGRGLHHQLDGGRVGRPRRRHVAAGPARPPRRAAHPVQGVQPPAGEDNIAKPPPADVLRVASWRDLPLRMRSLGPTAEAGAACASPIRRPMPASSCAQQRGRAAHRQGRQGQPALADRRPADRRHASGCPTGRAWSASRWSTRPAIPAPSPCASSSGA